MASIPHLTETYSPEKKNQNKSEMAIFEFFFSLYAAVPCPTKAYSLRLGNISWFTKQPRSIPWRSTFPFIAVVSGGKFHRGFMSRFWGEPRSIPLTLWCSDYNRECQSFAGTIGRNFPNNRGLFPDVLLPIYCRCATWESQRGFMPRF